VKLLRLSSEEFQKLDQLMFTNLIRTDLSLLFVAGIATERPAD